MRRFKQQLPEEECVEILNAAYRGFLSVIGENGYPYTIPINFVYVYYFQQSATNHIFGIKKGAKITFSEKGLGKPNYYISAGYTAKITL